MFWESVLIGILSGFIASIVFFAVMLIIKPRANVSSQICKRISKDSNKSVYQIKIVNLTRATLSNLRYCLQYNIDNGDGTSNVTEIKPSKSCLFYIDKYRRRDKDAKYAVRISFNIDESEHELKDRAYYIFTLYAQHGLSNTATCKREIYKSGSIIEGIFETGKSIKILRNK